MSLVVHETGPLLLVQDQGRSGSMHLGVPPSGALDRSALATANRLVGNPEAAAGLEVLVGGVRLQARTSLRIALTGAAMGLRIGGRAVSWGTAESVRAGELIEVQPTDQGLRSWLAISGGILADLVLGSRSTDTLTGLGPAAVHVGDVLGLGSWAGSATASGSAVQEPIPTGWTLAVVLGPRDDWFTPEALEVLFSQEYTVSSSSNRTALRLDGSTPLIRSQPGELPSEGIVTGAVQVPSSGQPLVFLADHPVTGGYPVVGVIEPRSVAACAQARPGDRLRLQRSRGR